MEQNDTNFYSQIAASLADNSFDDSDEDEVKLTQHETKQLAQSVDVDDMDANLFDSFSRGQNQKRSTKQRNKKAKTSIPSKMETTGDSVQSSGALSVGKGRGTQVKGKGESDVKRDSAKPTENKKSKSDQSDFDDLLDLLSDSEDTTPKKRTKPKIQLTTKSKSQQHKPAKADSKPITSPNDDNSPAGLGLERPSTSRGLPETNSLKNNPVSLETTTSLPEKKGKADILKLDTESTARDPIPRRTNRDASKSAINFDEDDDDILGGLGFDDGDSQSSSAKTATTKPTSRLDDLLGVNKPQPKNRSTRVKSGVSKDTDDSGFQFGSYVPSSVETSSAPPKRGGLKLPTGRRRGSSELDTSLTSRPSTAPSPAKKSVHFAEKLEISERPSSSPLSSEPKKSLLKTEKNQVSKDKQPVKRNDETGDKGGRLLSKKPPPLAMIEDGAGSDDVEEDSQLLGGTVVLDDSLFPSNESTPKHPSGNRSRRRPNSSSAASLFEDHPSNEGSENTLDDTNTPLPREPAKLQSNATKETEKLEHPVFPWQKPKATGSLPTISGKRQSSSSTGSTVTETLTQQASSSGSVPSSEVHVSINQDSQLASFQEQLLQQQKLLQEQLASFQAQSSEAVAAAKASSSAEVERLQGELQNAQGRVKELEQLVEKRNVEVSDKQKILNELEKQLTTSKETSQRYEEQFKEATDKLSASDRELAQVKLELSSQVEDLKMKLYKTELERDQLQHTVESMKSRHTEEIEAIQKSHESRVDAMEESVQRRETRWKEETAADAARFQSKLTLLEQEKTDAVLTVQKKLDALEINKTNEIGRLKDIHFSAIEELKREQELDKQHLLNLHRQELEAVKAAHSHTRMLSELSHKVEASTRDVTHLQAKLEHAHSTELDERMQRAKSQEEHLKTLEAQLMKQKSENNVERDQLQSLIAKMESHVSQQKRQTEQERWQLQQDLARLSAQQSAFEEERTSALLKLETEREKLQQTKEKLLSEQQEILSQCYEERRTLASERAELAVLQKRVLEREQKEKQMNLQSEAEREAALAHLREESDRIMAESTKLRQDQEQLRLDREVVNKDREKLEAFGAEIQQRSCEIEEITETAMLVREKGDQSLAESQRLQEELSHQTKAIQAQREELSEREKLLAVEQLSLAQERRKLQHLKIMSLSTPLPDTTGEGGAEKATNPLLSSRDVIEPLGSMQSLSNTSLPSFKGGASERLSASANRSSYSPKASPLHVSDLSKPSNVKSLLARIDQSRSLRRIALDAEKDDEYLEQEANFLQSLQSNPYIY